MRGSGKEYLEKGMSEKSADKRQVPLTLNNPIWSGSSVDDASDSSSSASTLNRPATWSDETIVSKDGLVDDNDPRTDDLSSDTASSSEVLG